MCLQLRGSAFVSNNLRITFVKCVKFDNTKLFQIDPSKVFFVTSFDMDPE